MDDARRWLRESLGSVHLTELDGGALHAQMLGQLHARALTQAEDGIAAHLRKTGDLRLLLDLREFDGWRGLSALVAHFKLVRENAPGADRIAVLGTRSWQEMAERVVGRLLPGKTEFFDDTQIDAAKAWLAQP